jgi:hypothetical protein
MHDQVVEGGFFWSIAFIHYLVAYEGANFQWERGKPTYCYSGGGDVRKMMKIAKLWKKKCGPQLIPPLPILVPKLKVLITSDTVRHILMHVNTKRMTFLLPLPLLSENLFQAWANPT